MKSLLQNEVVLQVLSSPWDWKLISSVLGSDVSPIVANELEPSQEAFIRSCAAFDHKHEYRQVCIVLLGKGTWCLGGQVFPFSPGTVALFEPMEVHGVEFIPPEQPLYVLRVDIDRRFFSLCPHVKAMPDPLNLSIRNDILTDSGAGVMLDVSWPRQEAVKDLPRFMVRGRFVSALYILLCAVFERGLGGAPPDVSVLQRDVVEEVRQRIARDPGQGANLDEVARSAGYSRSHFARVFKQHCGQTIHEYLDACRLTATKQLESRGCSRKEIAIALGFSGPSAFSFWLRKQRARRRAAV